MRTTIKHMAKPIAIAIAILLSAGLLVPVQAASKKSVYVCTKATVKDYTDDSKMTVKFAYKKNGLLNKTTATVSGAWFKDKNTYRYNGRSQIRKSTAKHYLFGQYYDKQTARYTYTKKGYLKKVIVYNAKGKKSSTTSFTRNSKGYYIKEKEYNSKGKLKSTTKYKVNKKGLPLQIRIYSAKGKLKSSKYYTYQGNTADTETYSAKGTLLETSVVKFKHGQLISEVSYDERNGHSKLTVEKYTYKKLSTAKAGKVRKQQRDVFNLFL